MRLCSFAAAYSLAGSYGSTTAVLPVDSSAMMYLNQFNTPASVQVAVDGSAIELVFGCWVDQPRVGAGPSGRHGLHVVIRPTQDRKDNHLGLK